MKTPREILLERHRAAGPKLDAIRQAVAGELSNKETKEQRGDFGLVSFCLGCLVAPWRELVLPSRRIWAGLAAVWVFILAVNISQRDNLSSVTGQPVRSVPAMVSLQVQQRMMNEVLADRAAAPEAVRPRSVAPGPRTEAPRRFTPFTLRAAMI
jgi:hypothetical protein